MKKKAATTLIPRSFKLGLVAVKIVEEVAIASDDLGSLVVTSDEDFAEFVSTKPGFLYAIILDRAAYPAHPIEGLSRSKDHIVKSSLYGGTSLAAPDFWKTAIIAYEDPEGSTDQVPAENIRELLMSNVPIPDSAMDNTFDWKAYISKYKQKEYWDKYPDGSLLGLDGYTRDFYDSRVGTLNNIHELCYMLELCGNIEHARFGCIFAHWLGSRW